MPKWANLYYISPKNHDFPYKTDIKSRQTSPKKEIGPKILKKSAKDNQKTSMYVLLKGELHISKDNLMLYFSY